MRTVPYFLDSVPRARRREYPRLRGHLDTGVVVVGGGLTGCACAEVFAAAGVDVVLLEAGRLAAGGTGATDGLLRQGYDASFEATVARHGLRTARTLWQGIRRASLDMAAAIRRLRLRCDLVSQDLVWIARGDAEASRGLAHEYKARRAAGLDVRWMTAAALAREAHVDADGAIRMRGDAVDPYRAAAGLAAAAAQRGAAIFERSQVRRIRAGRRRVAIVAEGGTIDADAVLVATDAPIPDLRALRRHLTPRQAYTVVTESLSAAIRKQVGSRAAALRDTHDPPHLLRWLKEDRILFSGAAQPPVAPRALDKAVVQRSGQLMYELSTMYPPISGLQPRWAWSAIYHDTPDGLPLVGAHRNFPRHLFALGQGRHGAGAAWLAARVLLRQFLGEAARGDERYGFSRIL
ncbi:MAG TPA: FAD-binding oxidoreductase [Vicinamibacterales bacterium]|nr:FAD-binding oxidoreductase [Vicinamibacterales bacterium]